MSNSGEEERIIAETSEVSTVDARLVERFLKMEQPVYAECSVLGMGMAVYCLGKALNRCGIPIDDIVAISCLHCTANISKTVKIDAFHTTQGRAIPFATGMQLANPRLKIIVLGSNEDLQTIGGSHFMNAARRNIDMTVLWINNFDYQLAGEQTSPIAIEESELNPPSIGNFVELFNIPYLAESSGAVYVARWTGLHFRKVTDSIVEALNKSGFSLIEILAPYPEATNMNGNDLHDKLDRLKLFYGRSEIKHGAETKSVEVKSNEEIIVGRFVDRERRTYSESMAQQFKKKLGDKV